MALCACAAITQHLATNCALMKRNDMALRWWRRTVTATGETRDHTPT